MTDLLIKLIPVFPLLAVILNGLFGRRYLSHEWRAPARLGIGRTLVSLHDRRLCRHPARTGTSHEVIAYQWIFGGDLTINLAYLVDPLTCIMLLVVTGVGFLIHVYSVGYMHGENGFTRFFTYMNLFMVSMLLLVMGNNYVVLFIGWEGVGLCSYLLIGYYYDKVSAAKAASKAFVVNRIGDAGFLSGHLPHLRQFQDARLYEGLCPGRPALAGDGHGDRALPARRSSRQIGPTSPLHLAPGCDGRSDTRQRAHPCGNDGHGRGLHDRAEPCHFRSVTDRHGESSASSAGVTALFAATIGLVQTDIKRVLAYSTVSQLGYMFLGCGIGAYTAAIFHLMTHAFFKALLVPLGRIGDPRALGRAGHSKDGRTRARRFRGPIDCF